MTKYKILLALSLILFFYSTLVSAYSPSYSMPPSVQYNLQKQANDVIMEQQRINDNLRFNSEQSQRDQKEICRVFCQGNSDLTCNFRCISNSEYTTMNPAEDILITQMNEELIQTKKYYDVTASDCYKLQNRNFLEKSMDYIFGPDTTIVYRILQNDAIARDHTKRMFELAKQCNCYDKIQTNWSEFSKIDTAMSNCVYEAHKEDRNKGIFSNLLHY